MTETSKSTPSAAFTQDAAPRFSAIGPRTEATGEQGMQ
jgi:hypothetical protein